MTFDVVCGTLQWPGVKHNKKSQHIKKGLKSYFYLICLNVCEDAKRSRAILEDESHHIVLWLRYWDFMVL